MRYIALIFGDETAYMQRSPAELDAEMQGYAVFNQAAAASGTLRGGEMLQPTTTATTVRVRNGQPLITDGPFAETKEQLAGFYILECANLDEALALAAQIPAASFGCVEVRPILELRA
jgi:hypothetical protein